MAYPLDIDPAARTQIRELSPGGTVALANAIGGGLARDRAGEAINTNHPNGAVYQLTFGGGLITYQLLTGPGRRTHRDLGGLG
jgi:hypothetical protein